MFLCPLKQIGLAATAIEYAPSCEKEYCAWWSTKHECCAIMLLAGAMHEQAKKGN